MAFNVKGVLSNSKGAPSNSPKGEKANKRTTIIQFSSPSGRPGGVLLF